MLRRPSNPRVKVWIFGRNVDEFPRCAVTRIPGLQDLEPVTNGLHGIPGTVPQGNEIPERTVQTVVIIGINAGLRNSPEDPMRINETGTFCGGEQFPEKGGGQLGWLANIFQDLNQSGDDPVFALPHVNNHGVAGEPLPLRGKVHLANIFRDEGKDVNVGVPLLRLFVPCNLDGTDRSLDLVPLNRAMSAAGGFAFPARSNHAAPACLEMPETFRKIGAIAYCQSDHHGDESGGHVLHDFNLPSVGRNELGGAAGCTTWTDEEPLAEIGVPEAGFSGEFPFPDVQPGTAPGHLRGQFGVYVVEVIQQGALTGPVVCETVENVRSVHGRGVNSPPRNP